MAHLALHRSRPSLSEAETDAPARAAGPVGSSSSTRRTAPAESATIPLAPLRRWARSLLVLSALDDVTPFAGPFLAMRWVAVTVALLLGLLDHRGWRVAVAGSVLGAYVLFRTLRVAHHRSRRQAASAMLAEVALAIVAVELTRYGDSPFLVYLAAAIFVTGFAGGLRLVLGAAGVSALAVVLPEVFVTSEANLLSSSLQLALVLVLLGAIGALGHHLVEEARREGEELHDLVEVNDLLSALHSATERLVLPLDLTSAAQWVLERLEKIVEPDAAAVLLAEEGAVDAQSSRWTVVASNGLGRAELASPLQLPSSLVAAAAGHRPLAVGEPYGPLAAGTRSAVYCPLRTGRRLVGLLVAECASPRSFAPADLERVGEMATAAALALDSARWLRRLYTLAVEEERSRLARELHDHIGQSIVYLGFELDRLSELNHGRAVQKDLVALRGEIRDVVGELRDTLVELRADVTDEQCLSRVLADFVARVNKRSSVPVEFVDLSLRRGPVPVEREFWRVAQEAVVNALKHARASRVVVVWSCDDESMSLEVDDDGIGLPAGAGRQARPGFGIVGMRERADAVSAQLDIRTEPGQGTCLTVTRAMRRTT